MNARNTRQKRLVSQILQEAERPLTIHEVLERAQHALPSLGIATVYREMNRLCESEEVHTVVIPGDPTRYETTQHHHHHFKCTGCNTVYELEGCLRNIGRLLPKGFRHLHHDITLYGLCRECA